MGAAASTQSPEQSPKSTSLAKTNQAFKDADFLVGSVGRHRRWRSFDTDDDSAVSLTDDEDAHSFTVKSGRVVTPPPRSQSMEYSTASSAASVSNINMWPGETEVTPEARGFFWRAEKELGKRLDYLQEFSQLYEELYDTPLPDETFNLLNGFQLHLKAVALQPDYCVGSANGLRLVINEFGVLSVMCTYDPVLTKTVDDTSLRSPKSSSDNNGGTMLKKLSNSTTAKRRPPLLRTFLELSLGLLFDVPRYAVAVAPWNPGNVAIVACFELDASKWTPEHKAKLVRQLHRQHRTVESVSALLQRGSSAKEARQLPVSTAAKRLQAAWRQFAASTRGRMILQARSQLRHSRTASSKHNDDSINVALLENDSVVDDSAIVQIEANRHDQLTRERMTSWWKQVQLSPNGLTGQPLHELGAELVSVLTNFEAVVLDVAGHPLRMRSAAVVASDPVALKKAGLPVLTAQNSSPLDEFSELLGETPTGGAVVARSEHGHHPIRGSTLVLQLRLRGLAAVLSRDLFDPSFDAALASAVGRIITAPEDIVVNVLGKRYGSVVVFVGVETCRRSMEGRSV